MTGPAFFTGAVVVVTVRPHDGGWQTLLLKRTRSPLKGTWLYPTGRIEAEETAAVCAVRELYEETAVRAERLYSANFVQPFYAPDREAIALFPVFVAHLRADAEIRLSEEASDHLWCSFDKARGQVPVSAARLVLQHVEREVLPFAVPESLHFDPLNGHPLGSGAGAD